MSRVALLTGVVVWFGVFVLADIALPRSVSQWVPLFWFWLGLIGVTIWLGQGSETSSRGAVVLLAVILVGILLLTVGFTTHFLWAVVAMAISTYVMYQDGRLHLLQNSKQRDSR